MDPAMLGWIAVGIAALALAVGHFLRNRREHFSVFEKAGVPGPPPSLLFGNMQAIYKSSHLDMQREWHAKYGPIMGYFLGYTPCLSVADADTLKQILLKDFHNFTDRPKWTTGGNGGGVENALTALRGQRWKDIRSTLTPSFTSKKLRQLDPEVGRVVDDFMSNVEKCVEKGTEFNIYELYQALTLDTICRTAMGVDFHIQKEMGNSKILQQVKVMFQMSLNWFSIIILSFPLLSALIGRYFRKMRMRARNNGTDPVATLKAECKKVIELRRNNPEHRRVDLLQLMIDAQGATATNVESLIAGDELEKREAKESKDASQCPMAGKSKGLTNEEIIDNALIVLLAGYETTSSSLAFVTRLLLRFPEVQERLREELLQATDNGTVFDFERLQKCHYMEAVIQEALRMYPPVYSFTGRDAIDEKVYGDITIPKDMSVFASAAVLHYNEDIYPNAKEFQPERFLPENKTPEMAWAWQPFGAGPRNCIGMRFAQMEIKIALAKLLTKYRMSSDSEPLGETKIAVNKHIVIQRILDDLMCKLTPV